jgi:hypothetical protein
VILQDRTIVNWQRRKPTVSIQQEQAVGIVDYETTEAWDEFYGVRMPQQRWADAMQFSELSFAGIEREDTQRAVDPDEASGVRIARDMVL